MHRVDTRRVTLLEDALASTHNDSSCRAHTQILSRMRQDQRNVTAYKWSASPCLRLAVNFVQILQRRDSKTGLADNTRVSDISRSGHVRGNASLLRRHGDSGSHKLPRLLKKSSRQRRKHQHAAYQPVCRDQIQSLCFLRVETYCRP